MKRILTVCIAAATHQIRQIDELFASLLPISDCVSVVFDLLVTAQNEEEYLEKLRNNLAFFHLSARRVRYDGALGEGRNWALGSSKTRYVMFIDGDDFIHSENLSFILRDLQRKVATFRLVLFSGYLHYPDVVRPWMNDRLPTYSFLSKNELLDWFSSHGWRMTTACLKLYSTDWLKRHKLEFPTGILYEDTPFWFDVVLNLAETDCTLVYNLGIYFYRREQSGPHQITSRSDFRVFDVFWMLDILKRKLIEGCACERIWRAYHTFSLDHLKWSSSRVDSWPPSSSKSLFQARCDDYSREAHMYFSQQ